MTRHQSRRLTNSFKRIEPRYFFVLAAVFTASSVILLRANNEHMIKLRSAVYSADQRNDHVEESLRALQAYVVAHMNTDLSGGSSTVYPPVQLKYTYDRLVQAESEALAQTNSQLYTAAQVYCEAQRPTGYVINRIGCITDYLQSHDTKHEIAPVPDALYKFAFASPKWSPDLAGWSIFGAVISCVLFVVSFLVRRLWKV